MVTPGSKDASAHAADGELVRRARAGDAQAVEALIARLACVPAMLRDRHRQWGSPLSAEELADVEQETLAALWSKLGTFAGRAAIETWAFRFTVHELMKGIDRLRRGRRNVGEGQVVLESRPQGEREEPELEPATVHAALERLGPPANDVVRMRHFDELSFEEIARRTSELESTVKARYYRGLDRLRELLEPHRRKMTR